MFEVEEWFSTHQLKVVGKSRSVITGVADVKLHDPEPEPGIQHGEARGAVMV